MKTAIFSTQSYEQSLFNSLNTNPQHVLTFFATRLTPQTAILAAGYPVVSCFVLDQLSNATLEVLAKNGAKMIALRSAGFNHVDLVAAKKLGLVVTRVPAYSPYAVAEFAVGLILMLNRKLYRAYNQVRAQNFSLEGLMGFDLHGKTVGIIGTGKIGTVFAHIMHCFGCKLLANDIAPNEECKKLGGQYVELPKLYAESDIISLHCSLTDQTRHIINKQALAQMKPQVMLINTGRGALLDTKEIINALKNSKIGYLGIDVYEEEENLFFQDLSNTTITDEVFIRLQTFPNVVITGHQAFFTQEAVTNIIKTTLANITAFEQGHGEMFTVQVE